MKRTRVQKDREYTFINDDSDWEELLNQHNCNFGLLKCYISLMVTYVYSMDNHRVQK